jgi:hypothetical protein
MGTETTKKILVPMDRISLQGEARDRVQKWVEELNTQIKGLRLTKTDLVTYLILDHAETLSADDVLKIRKGYFDEVRFATWLLKEVKEAQKRGETPSIEGLIGREKPKRAPSKKPKVPQSEAADGSSGGVL